MAAEASRIPAALPLFRLSELRQQRGISLEEIADATKISLRFLRAIEAEDVNELPEGVFRVNYVRQYANCVGVNEADLWARLSPVPPVLPPPPVPRKWLRKLF